MNMPKYDSTAAGAAASNEAAIAELRAAGGAMGE
jgi:hypothetical protein